jgi:hypothetical protein
MTIVGSCHCGKTAFRIESDIPVKLTRCTCSLCSKRGALWAYYQPSQFQVTTPSIDDATYRWHPKLVAHHFCPECGCTTFSDSPAFEPDGRSRHYTTTLSLVRVVFAWGTFGGVRNPTFRKKSGFLLSNNLPKDSMPL